MRILNRNPKCNSEFLNSFDNDFYVLIFYISNLQGRSSYPYATVL